MTTDGHRARPPARRHRPRDPRHRADRGRVLSLQSLRRWPGDVGAGRSRVLPAARGAGRRSTATPPHTAAGESTGPTTAHELAGAPDAPCSRLDSSCGAVRLLATRRARAQDPTGTIEGGVTDKTSSAVAGAHVVGHQPRDRLHREATAGARRLLPPAAAPVGAYRVTVEAPQFATLVQRAVQVNVSQTVRVNVQLELSSLNETVTVSGGAQLVDTSTNALGRVVTGRELVDLPLNGRNFTQLGLLQTGVAPLTAGVATAGGSLRQGQAYAVNGMRPEQNVYLVDGAQNNNRMDGGYRARSCRWMRSPSSASSRRARRPSTAAPAAPRPASSRVGRQRLPRQPLRVPAQRRLRRAQLLLRGGRAAQPAPVRRHDRRPDRRRIGCSSSATTKASATSRA